MGLLFESLVIRDLRIYGQRLDARLNHYRDSAGVEVDATVTAPDGGWLAVDIKLGAGQVDAAAALLIRFAENVDSVRTPGLAGLAVATTGVTRIDERMGFGWCRWGCWEVSQAREAQPHRALINYMPHSKAVGPKLIV